jgi:hypothetical protein
VEPAAGKAEVGGIGLNHDDVVAESSAENVGAPRMELDRDDPRARLEKGGRERAGAGTDVEDQVAGADAAVGDELFSPARLELVPAPPPWR